MPFDALTWFVALAAVLGLDYVPSFNRVIDFLSCCLSLWVSRNAASNCGAYLCPSFGGGVVAAHLVAVASATMIVITDTTTATTATIDNQITDGMYLSALTTVRRLHTPFIVTP